MAKSPVEEPGPKAFNDSARKYNASLATTTTILQGKRPRQFGIGLRRHVTIKIKASNHAKPGVCMGHARANGLRLSIFLFHCRPGDPEGTSPLALVRQERVSKALLNAAENVLR